MNCTWKECSKLIESDAFLYNPIERGLRPKLFCSIECYLEWDDSGCKVWELNAASPENPFPGFIVTQDKPALQRVTVIFLHPPEFVEEIRRDLDHRMNG